MPEDQDLKIEGHEADIFLDFID
ncbi:unnamed protein product [Victoria cruziana]